MLLTIQEPRAAAPRGFALWNLGFRPFYLVAAVYAALSILLWALPWLGWAPGVFPQGSQSHAHEMLFGFTSAVIVGFLFTAGRTWSGQPTPSGLTLQLLVATWVAGRVLAYTRWTWAAAAADALFAFGSAVGLGRALWAGRNRRNYFFVALLAALGALAVVRHAGPGLGWPLPPLTLALDVVLFVLAVMGGRVIPMFTNNGVPTAKARKLPGVEQAALGSVLALLAADGLGAPATVLVPVLAVAAAAHLVRWALWTPWRTLGKPLVWVLHAAYLWVPLHLALRALAEVGLLAPGAATHALTVGAIGGLIIGMMTRTSRGHTGRLLRADSWDVTMYALVLGAALVRVAVPLILPAATVGAIVFSGLAWSAGFALFALRYGPWLCAPRIDGQPG